MAENIHKQIENLRIKLGGYFQSQEILFVNVFLQFDAVRYSKWKKPIPLLKNNLYELHQLFNLKFFKVPFDVQIQNSQQAPT
jgi:hypothetical protein